MYALTPGYRYALASLEGGEPQTLQFVEKVPAIAGNGTLVTINDGTTNEEVLLVLLDRLTFLNAKFPCPENAAAAEHLAGALLLLKKRTADRQARGVEGRATK